MPPDPITLREYRNLTEEELAEEARREAFARWYSFLAAQNLEEMAQDHEREAS